MKDYAENINLITNNNSNNNNNNTIKSNVKYKINNNTSSLSSSINTLDSITYENTNTNSITNTNILQKKKSSWIKIKLEKWFQLKKRNSNIEREIYCGIIQFISCLYVIAVIPIQMNSVGYIENVTIITICITCCIGNIIASFVTNLPFILAPSTAVSIFLAASLKQEGNMLIYIYIYVFINYIK
jgi:hypothetical protein